MADEHPVPRPAGADAPIDELGNLFSLGLAPNAKGLRFWEILSSFGFVLGLVFEALYACSTPSFLNTFGILSLLGTAAWLTGAVLGFLFGVPRLRAAAAPSSTSAQPASSGAFTPNTNLEQISDWLTKIIVGATLVQIAPIADRINQLSISVGAQIAAKGASTVSGGVVVLYFAGGFMWGYLWCSLRIFKEMSALTDRANALDDREQLVAEREKNLPQP